MHANKEPWLAAVLSWLIPGLGQVYYQYYFRGGCLILCVAVIPMCWSASMCSARIPLWAPILLALSNGFLLPAVASMDAFMTAKRQDARASERDRIGSNDAWLAFFLSMLLPGAGHIYLRKHIVGVAALAGFVVLRLAGVWSAHLGFLLASISVRILTAWHAHLVCLRRGKSQRRLLGGVTLLLLGVLSVRGLLLPRVKSHFFVLCSITGPSMVPAIADGSRVVVDRLTYSVRDPLPGDIVVFISPDSVEASEVTAACKRIAAIGGEAVRIRDGRIYIDNKERRLGGLGGGYAYDGSTFYIGFPGRRNPYLAHGVDEPYQVPDGEYFVLGDNGHYSVDSRLYGGVPSANIVGRVCKVISARAASAFRGSPSLNANCQRIEAACVPFASLRSVQETRLILGVNNESAHTPGRPLRIPLHGHGVDTLREMRERDFPQVGGSFGEQPRLTGYLMVMYRSRANDAVVR